MARKRNKTDPRIRAGKKLANCLFKLAREVLEDGNFEIIREPPPKRKEYLGEICTGTRQIYVPPASNDSQTLFHEIIHAVISGVEIYSSRKGGEYESWEEVIVENATTACWRLFSDAQIAYFIKKLPRS